MTGRTLKRIKSFQHCSENMTEKYRLKSRIFRNVTGCNNFSLLSLHFKKKANSLRDVLQTYLEICTLCVIHYIAFHKQSVGGAVKVLEKSLKAFLDEFYFKLICIVSHLCLPQDNPFPQISYLPSSKQNSFQNFLLLQTLQ